MNKDQKLLELLYEQVIANKEESFLFNDEKQFIEAMVRFYIEQFKNYPRFQEITNKDTSVRQAFAFASKLSRPVFSDFCTYNLSDREQINYFYYIGVAVLAEHYIFFNNKLSKTGEHRLAFRFMDITDAESKKSPLIYFDKNSDIIEQKIKENLIAVLKLYVFPKRLIKSKYEQIWFDWRQDRIKRNADLDKQLSSTFSKEDLGALEDF